MRRKIVDGLVWGIGGRILLLFFNFLTIVVTARLLSPTDFGVYATAQIFIELGYAIANSTLGTPIMRTRVLSTEMERVGFAAFLFVAITFSALMGFGGGLISSFFNMSELADVIVFIALVMPFRIMSGYYISVMLQKMHMRWYQVSQTLPQILGALLTIVMAHLGFGLWSLVCGFAVSVFSELLIGMMQSGAQNRFPQTMIPVREYWRIGSGTLAARGASVVVSNTDKAVIANLIDAAAVGLYTRAFSIMMIPFKVITLVATRIFLTSFSKIEQAAERSKALEKILALQAYVYIPMSVGLWLASEFLVRLALGEKWVDCIPICQILSCALFARLGYEVINNALTAVGKVWLMAQRVTATIPIMIISCVVGQYWGGLNGVAIAVSTTIISVYLISVAMACHEFNCAFRPIVRAHIVGTALAILSGLAAFGLADLPLATTLPGNGRTLLAPLYFTALVLAAWVTMPKMFLGGHWAELKKW